MERSDFLARLSSSNSEKSRGGMRRSGLICLRAEALLRGSSSNCLSIGSTNSASRHVSFPHEKVRKSPSSAS